MAKKGSKNNISNRGKGALLRSYNGVDVKPAMYYMDGKKAMVAQTASDGKIVFDAAGKPVLYKETDEPLVVN